MSSSPGYLNNVFSSNILVVPILIETGPELLGIFTVYKEVYQIINIITLLIFYHKAICCKVYLYELINIGMFGA